MDVIARTAFGIETNSYKNPNDPFIAHGKRVFSSPVVSPVAILMIIFPRLVPFLTRLFKYSMYYPKNSLEFFIDASKQIIEQRKTDVTTGRVDLLQLMLNSEHDVHKSLTVNEIVSQSFIVFVAGYETTATLLTFASYVLATHPDVQTTLQEEIDEHIPRDCKEITYEKVMELPYLDQFVNETLRVYPPVTAMTRATSDDRDVQIDGYWFPRNTMIQFNMYMIHHDENNYPEPEKFIPERFAPDAKANFDPFAFIPFGHGPRNCIGMRLALLEAKIALVNCVRKVKFVATEETEVPLKLVTSEVFLRPEKPIKIAVEAR